MTKAALQAKLPLLDARHTELTVELHRIEGEFRAISNLIKEWPETKELVNAEAESSDNLRNKPSK